MSNKLKTLSASKLEEFIANTVGEYIDEDCECEISNMSTPNIDSEDEIAVKDKRDLTFDVKISYKDSNG